MATPGDKEPSRTTTIGDTALSDDALAATRDSGVSPGRSGAVDRGTSIGPFVVVEPIGSGGMGVVFAAHDPVLDRKVAIKLLRPDIFGASPTRSARLLREAQALAKLSHPNVVTVYQAGAVDDQVFIAMELVEGRTLTSWLAEPRTPGEILDAFRAAGRGLAAAHRAGLIHRDFKPDNVLVGDDGRVRVTDFGLVGLAGARDLDADATPSPPSPLAAALTDVGAMLGTPRYMAPEQFEAIAVDARADEFAFGVALYEALYRTSPFRGKTPAELHRNIQAGEVRPISDESKAPRWLAPIVRRALQARPDQRYATMDELLAALDRGPPRGARRAGLAAGAFAVVGAAALGWWGLRPQPCRGAADKLVGVWDAPTRTALERAFLATERPLAREAFAKTATAFDAYARAWVAMRTDACMDTVRQEQSETLRDLRMSCLDQRLDRLRALGAVLAQGELDVVRRAVPAAMALDPLDECADAAALAGSPAPPADPAIAAQVEEARGRRNKANALFAVGKVALALDELKSVAADVRRLGYRPLLADVLTSLGWVSADGDPKAAQAALEEAVAIGSEVKNDKQVADAHIKLMWVIGVKQARRGEALAMRPLVDAAVRRAGNGDMLRARFLHLLARVLINEGELTEAETVLNEALALRERALGPDDVDVGRTLVHLSIVRSRQARFDEARAYAERALAIYERRIGPQSIEVAGAITELGNLAWYTKDFVTAERSFERVITIMEGAYQGPSSDLAGAHHNLGLILHEQGKYAEARVHYEKALADNERIRGPDHPAVAQTLYSLGELAGAEGRVDEARAFMERALAIQEKRLAPDHPERAYVLVGLAEIDVAAGKPADAVPRLEQALAIREKRLGPEHPDTARTLIGLGEARLALGQVAAATALLERAVRLLEGPPQRLDQARAKFALARAIQHDRARALALAREARATLAAAGGRSQKKVAEIDGWLARH